MTLLQAPRPTPVARRYLLHPKRICALQKQRQSITPSNIAIEIPSPFTTTLPSIILQNPFPIYFDDALSSHANLVIPFRPQGGVNRPHPPAHGVYGRPSALSIDHRTICPYIKPRMAGRHLLPARVMATGPFSLVPMARRDPRTMRQS